MTWGKGGISNGEGILVMGAGTEQLLLSCTQAEEGGPRLEPPNTQGAVPLQQQFSFSISLLPSLAKSNFFLERCMLPAQFLGINTILVVASCSQKLACLWRVPCLLWLLLGFFFFNLFFVAGPGWHVASVQ